MSRPILKSGTDICHICEFLLPRQLPVRQSCRPFRPRPQPSLRPSRAFTTVRRKQANSLPSIRLPSQGASSKNRPVELSKNSTGKVLADEELQVLADEIKSTRDKLLATETIVSDHEVLSILRSWNTLAGYLAIHSLPTRSAGAASALLSLDESPRNKKIPAHTVPPMIQRTIYELSKSAHLTVKHPFVFITPEVLDVYTEIQAHLGKAESFPDVFYLYANKPIPQGSSTITYSKQNPNKISNAIPVHIGDRALQTAIDSKEMSAAMGIVDLTYTTTAFHRAKFLRKGLIPASAVALAPLAAYTLAIQLSGLQTTMDGAMATNVAFVGILGYTFFTGTIGIVALTTANDQMERVTWAPGMPLRERWMREEERAAIDKIAVSWGFKEVWRRGEEEGKDWEALREWIGVKGMILDRVELMDGME